MKTLNNYILESSENFIFPKEDEIYDWNPKAWVERPEKFKKAFGEENIKEPDNEKHFGKYILKSPYLEKNYSSYSKYSIDGIYIFPFASAPHAVEAHDPIYMYIFDSIDDIFNLFNNNFKPSGEIGMIFDINGYTSKSLKYDKNEFKNFVIDISTNKKIRVGELRFGEDSYYDCKSTIFTYPLRWSNIKEFYIPLIEKSKFFYGTVNAVNRYKMIIFKDESLNKKYYVAIF